MTSGLIIGGIFFACDELFRVEELVVGAGANLINDCGFQVDKHCPGHMLASPCLTEEGVEGVVSSPNNLVTWHLAIRLNAVFQAVELPAGIADLDTSLEMHSHAAAVLQLPSRWRRGGEEVVTSYSATQAVDVREPLSLLFNRLVITFLPRSKRLLISWLQSPSAVILEPPKNKVNHCFHCFPIYLP